MSVADHFTEETEAADRSPSLSIHLCYPPDTHLDLERTYTFRGTTLRQLQMNRARIWIQGAGIKWKGGRPVGVVVQGARTYIPVR